MPRLARLVVPGYPHHVTQRGVRSMENHVHLIAIPEREDSLASAIGGAHRRYTRMKNFASGVRGYLFQGRFISCVMDERHLLAAGRYIENNPAKAGIVSMPQQYPWSSCRYHCELEKDDPLVQNFMLPSLVDNWMEFLVGVDVETENNFREKTRTGRPAGDDSFVFKIEVTVGRMLRKRPPGRPRKLK